MFWRHLFQDLFKVSPHDLVKPFVSGGYLPLKKVTVDNKSIGGVAEQNRRAKNSQVLCSLFRGWVCKTDFERCPLASDHHPNRVEPDHHAVLVFLTRDIDIQVL